MAIPILGVVHANINCSDLTRSTAFYRELLGLEVMAHTHPKPQDGTGFGLPGDVEWDAHILQYGHALGSTALDLLEWKLPPPVGSPYAEAHHLGAFRLCFLVRDIDALYQRLRARDVPCLSAPVEVPVEPEKGLRVRVFLCKDPDGTVLEFVEQREMEPQLIHVNVNCSDLRRSLDWYQRVLELEITGHSQPGPVSGEAFGLAGEVEWEAYFLFPRGRPASFGIDLLEWKRPRPVGRPYSSANHLGLYRVAFLVADARASYEELRAQGVTCPPPVWLDMGPEIPVDGLWAVFFSDPDGTFLELIQAPEVRG